MKEHNPSSSRKETYQAQSSILSSEYCEYQLTRTDKRRLDLITHHISKTIFALRNNKIALMEKQNQLLTEKLQLEQKIRDFQAIERNRRIDESTKCQKILLAMHQKKYLALEKLKQTQKEFMGSSSSQKEIHLQKALMHENLKKEGIELEEEVKKWQKAQQIELSIHSLSSREKLIEQINLLEAKKNSITQQKKSQRKKALQIEIKSMRCDQIKEFLLKNNIRQRISQIFDLLNNGKWQEYKTVQIEEYVQSQSREKEKLFQQIYKMNESLKKMQEQNISMQQTLKGESIQK